MIKNIIIFISILISLEVYANKISILSDEIGSGTLVENHFKVIVNYRGTLENGIEFDIKLVVSYCPEVEDESCDQLFEESYIEFYKIN
jgi:hypothetical protein